MQNKHRMTYCTGLLACVGLCLWGVPAQAAAADIQPQSQSWIWIIIGVVAVMLLFLIAYLVRGMQAGEEEQQAEQAPAYIPYTPPKPIRAGSSQPEETASLFHQAQAETGEPAASEPESSVLDEEADRSCALKTSAQAGSDMECAPQASSQTACDLQNEPESMAGEGAATVCCAAEKAAEECAAPPVDTVVTETLPIRFCPYCGQKLNQTQRFCQRCGQRVRS